MEITGTNKQLLIFRPPVLLGAVMSFYAYFVRKGDIE